ncbi:hypothetical protein ACYUMT_03815 [Latilactobacillus sakei]
MVEMDIQKMAEAFQKLQALQDEHIGNRGTAVHQTATQSVAGFMSSSDKIIIDQKGLRATGVDNGTDILTLNIGYYAGRSLTNGPRGGIDDTVCTVKVEGYNDLKKYTFDWLSGGKQWVRYVYATVTDTGWTDNGWVNCILKNGFTGRCVVKKTKMLHEEILSLRFDVAGTFAKHSAPVDFANLPAGWTTLDPNRIVNVGRAQYESASGLSNFCPVGFDIRVGNTLQLVHLDTLDFDLTNFVGSATFIRSDSTV